MQHIVWSWVRSLGDHFNIFTRQIGANMLILRLRWVLLVIVHLSSGVRRHSRGWAGSLLKMHLLWLRRRCPCNMPWLRCIQLRYLSWTPPVDLEGLLRGCDMFDCCWALMAHTFDLMALVLLRCITALELGLWRGGWLSLGWGNLVRVWASSHHRLPHRDSVRLLALRDKACDVSMR